MINRKKPLDIEFPETNWVKKDNWTITTRQYKLITPLWGGGVEANVNDPVTLIRGSSIRGHLRFWWRALRGNSNAGTIVKMRERENEIWGSTKAPSQVKISVRVINPGREFHPIDSRGRPINDIGAVQSMDTYIAFPLRQTNSELKENVEFTLELEFPNDYEKDVEAALWAWQTFGGIGARTRRGMGAIECTHIDDVPQKPVTGSEYGKYIRKKLETWIEEGDFPLGVPHLSRVSVFKLTGNQNYQTGIEALRNIIGQYKRFRQSRPGGGPHPGRSHWPEPDLIKDCFPKKTFRHPPGHKVQGKAPRAVFGLPIIIRFKEYNDGGHEDPDDTTIQGVGKIDRLASPLIIRPVLLNEGFAGLAVLLEWKPLNANDKAYTPPGGLTLMQGDKVLFNPSAKLTPAEAKHITPLDGNTNPLTKFIDSIY